ncbi:MAG: 3TM-type holin [Anaerolineaceae bacterium]
MPDKMNTAGEWIRGTWRPMMAYAYMAIVIFDFLVGPIFWSIIQIVGAGSVALQWIPLTLTNGGIFHAAMGAVLGISAFTRGQEKIECLRNEFHHSNGEDTSPSGRRNRHD